MNGEEGGEREPDQTAKLAAVGGAFQLFIASLLHQPDDEAVVQK